MFAKKARKPLAGPESLSTDVINDRSETNKVLREVQPVLIERRTTVERGLHSLEAVRHLQVGNSDQAPTTGVRMMRGVPENRIEPIKEQPVAPDEQLQKTPTLQLVEAPVRVAATAKTQQPDEARVRQLLQDDAHRQIDEAFDPEKTFEAAVIDFPEEQPIPNLRTIDTEHVIAARAGVEAALQSQAEVTRKHAQAEQDAESLRRFLAEHHEQRRAAA